LDSFVWKLLWHFLKCHRNTLGDKTYCALLSSVTDDEGTGSLSIASFEFLQSIITLEFNNQNILSFDLDLLRETFAKAERPAGKHLKNALALSTLLRLLRFLDDEYKDRWLTELLQLTKANRKCVAVLAALAEWQPCLFTMISETLELVSSRAQNQDGGSGHDPSPDGGSSSSSTNKYLHERLDRCLHLYSVLLGHLLRSGGDKVSRVD
jgi:hypothetical protein